MENEDRGFFGSVQSPQEISPLRLPSPTLAAILEANARLEPILGMNTGNSWSLSRPSNQYVQQNNFWERRLDIWNSPEVVPPTPTVSRTRPPLRELDLNWGHSRLVDHPRLIGSRSGLTQNGEKSKAFLHQYEFRVIAPLGELALITEPLSQWTDLLSYSLGPLVRASPTGLGRKLAGTHLLKIQELNGGTATRVKKMLLSTNLEEESTLHTYYDGWTNTLSLWKSRDPPCR